MVQSDSEQDLIEKVVRFEDDFREARGTVNGTGIVLQIDTDGCCVLRVYTECGKREYEKFDDEERANREFDDLVEKYDLTCQC